MGSPACGRSTGVWQPFQAVLNRAQSARRAWARFRATAAVAARIDESSSGPATHNARVRATCQKTRAPFRFSDAAELTETGGLGVEALRPPHAGIAGLGPRRRTAPLATVPEVQDVRLDDFLQGLAPAERD